MTRDSHEIVQLGIDLDEASEEKPQSESPVMPVYPHCGAGYDATEYGHDAPEWSCPQCGKALPKE
jgi:hypothetical protein